MPTNGVKSKVPLKADLLKAQRVWKRLLTSVITDGLIRRINGDNGQPVAYVVPIEQYKRMNGVISLTDARHPMARMAGKQTAFYRWAAGEIFKLADENPGEIKSLAIAMPGEVRYYEIRLREVEKRP